jgi:hypothetical protein
LIVAISIVSVGPAVWAHDAALLREHVIQLLLAAIATGLCLVEANRSELGDAEVFEPEAETAPATTGAPLKIWKH